LIRRALVAAAALVLILSAAAQAQFSQFTQGPSSGSGPGWTLLGDIQAQSAFYGVIAYNAAQAAAGTQKVFDLRRGGDNATCSPLIGTNGVVDLTVGTPCNGNTQTVTAWPGGSNATCVGSIATTTLTVTSCSAGTLAVNDHITDVNISLSTYITAIGTCATPPGTCTVSVSQTAASATFTAVPPELFAAKIYDLSVGSHCAGSCDLTSLTNTRQPQLLLTGCGVSGTLPCLTNFSNTSPCCTAQTTGNFTPNASGIFSMSGILWRSGSTNAINFITQNINGLGVAGSAANWNLKGTTGTITEAATNAAWHVINGAATTTSTSAVNINNVETTGTVTGSTAAAQISGTFGSITDKLQIISLGYVDNVASSSTIRASIATNGCKAIGTTC
jgi:hypothetical protein